MIVGITGSQIPRPEAQLIRLESLLLQLRVAEIHHGDCVGADAQAHAIAQLFGIPVVLHPPDDPSRRAFCEAAEVRPELPYLERNTNIATEPQALIALPGQFHEITRSGTWATVRRARAAKVPVFIIWPDGTLEKP